MVKEEPVELSIDFDEPDVAPVSTVIGLLRGMYPDGRVLVRQSSSGEGWHVYLQGIWFHPDDAMRLRAKLGDCEGRLAVDSLRREAGLTTSTLFGTKAKIENDRLVVKNAGEWMTSDKWLERYGGIPI